MLKKQIIFLYEASMVEDAAKVVFRDMKSKYYVNFI